MYDAITDEMGTHDETARMPIVMEPSDEDVRAFMQMANRGSAPLIIYLQKDRRKERLQN